MNALEFRHLKHFCDKYGIDYYEIDNTLTYQENKEHLQSMVRKLSRSLDMFEIERMAELQRQYMKEHFVSYYLACQMAGETTSNEVATPIEQPHFSLRAWVNETNQNTDEHLVD